MNLVYETGFFIDVKNLFSAPLIYGCQIWGQDQNEEFKTS